MFRLMVCDSDKLRSNMHITIKIDFFQAALESSKRCKIHSWWQRIPNVDYGTHAAKTFFPYVAGPAGAVIIIQFVSMFTHVCCSGKNVIYFVSYKSKDNFLRILIILECRSQVQQGDLCMKCHVGCKETL